MFKLSLGHLCLHNITVDKHKANEIAKDREYTAPFMREITETAEILWAELCPSQYLHDEILILRASERDII